MSAPMPPRRRQAGFTFLELSFIIVALGLVTALLAQVVPAMRQASTTAATVRSLVNVQHGLESYAAIHGRLPCADIDDDGIEDATPCRIVGKLPYLTLGHAGPLVNAEGYDFRYALYHRDGASLRQNAQLGLKTERYRPSTGALTDGDDPTVALTDKPYKDGSNGRLDFCQGLRAGMDLPFDASFLHVAQGSAKKHVAYVLVDPGVGNMDLLGDRFDGLNGSATSAAPQFDHPNRRQSMSYDDRVVVTYFDQLWESLGCSANMATAGRAHPNVETMLALFRQSAADYRIQLDIAVDMAYANNFTAGAAIASATTGLAASGSALVIGVASAINKAGATAGASVSAGVAVGLNTAALAVAITNQVLTVQSYEHFKSYRDDLDTLVSTRLDPLYESVKADVARAGLLVYSDH